MLTTRDAQIDTQIQAAEDRLRAAMLASDLATLDTLLSPDLIFTNHLGRRMGKEEDMAAHRSGLLQIHALDTSEQQVQLLGDVAIVSVRVQLSGTYEGSPANGIFRFTRVWALSPQKTWRVVAAHAGLVA